MKKIAFLSMIATAACLSLIACSDASPTNQVQQDLCKQDPLTGLCSGEEQEIAQEESETEVTDQTGSTDVAVTGECHTFTNGLARGLTCEVVATVGSSLVNFSCTVIIDSNGGAGGADCTISGN